MSGNTNTLVAVVTGANKGVGFGVVRGLCKQFKGDVYLTARNEKLGLKAVEDLKKEGLSPKFHILDITKPETITALKTFLQTTYGGLDVLVNNAGMAYKVSSDAPFGEQAEVTVGTNFTGTLNVCEVLFPILRPHARVANVSSLVSISGIKKCSSDLRARLVDPNLSMDELKGLMQTFVEAAKKGTHQKEGWPNTAYGVSKIGVTAMSLIQQRELLKDSSRPDIIVNACCPGYVNTDMSSHKGPKTIDQGADTPVYLAMLPRNTLSPKGDYVSDRKIGKWE